MSWRDTSDEIVVYEAARMIVNQAGCTEADALAKLEDHARSTGNTVADTALSVVAGTIRFDEN